MWKITAIVIVFALLAFGIIFFFRGSEDDWIKDERGVWIKHGVPDSKPAKVLVQEAAINAALQLFQEKKLEMNFSSQCLGVVQMYAVDIVHVPRTVDDDKQENQCDDYRLGIVDKFIELDKDGNVVRVKD